MSQAQEIAGLKRALETCARKNAEAREREVAAKERIAILETALQPFAEIKPSTFYAPDGSEKEGYFAFRALLAEDKVEFTGEDLARARAALQSKS